MTVFYLGYKYKVKFWQGIKYYIFTMMLFIKRTLRQVCNLFIYILPVLILIPVWIVFIIVLGSIENGNIWCYFYEAKYSIFTSVIIAAVLQLQTKISAHHKNLLIQHERYVSLMCDADEFIDYISKRISTKCGRQIQIPEWPLYTVERYRKTDMTLPDCFVFDYSDKFEINKLIELIIDDINELKLMHASSSLYVDHYIEYTLESAYRRIKDFQCALRKCQVDKSIVEYTIRELFFLVDEVRFPWRRDEALNKKRRQIIVSNNPNTENRGHYFNLFEEFK